jgi:hypothetical protein
MNNCLPMLQEKSLAGGCQNPQGVLEVSEIDIIHACKDQEYCRSLTEYGEQASLLDNSAGILEPSGSEPEQVVGSTINCSVSTAAVCRNSVDCESGSRIKGIIHRPSLDSLSLIFERLTFFKSLRDSLMA